jgi:hypothetical protein
MPQVNAHVFTSSFISLTKALRFALDLAPPPAFCLVCDSKLCQATRANGFGYAHKRVIFLGTPMPTHAQYTTQLVTGWLYFQIFPTPDDLHHAFQMIHSPRVRCPDQRAEKQTTRPLRDAFVP